MTLLSLQYLGNRSVIKTCTAFVAFVSCYLPKEITWVSPSTHLAFHHNPLLWTRSSPSCSCSYLLQYRRHAGRKIRRRAGYDMYRAASWFSEYSAWPAMCCYDSVTYHVLKLLSCTFWCRLKLENVNLRVLACALHTVGGRICSYLLHSHLSRTCFSRAVWLSPWEFLRT